MLTRIHGGRLIDPANSRDEVADLWMEHGRIIEAPAGAVAATTYDATGMVVMAGAIDIHSHIAGGNVNTARLLFPEWHVSAVTGEAPLAAGFSAYATGCGYAAMGFTTVVEPAVLPHQALQAHLELADVPIIDKAILAVLGNDDYLLRLLRETASGGEVSDYVAFTLQQTRALGIKAINAGGAAAFKANMRAFSLDDVVPWYGVTSRAIVKALQRAVIDLGVPHPLHLHCNNLGLPGSAATAIATIEAAEGLALHLAHVQFYSYGKEGERGFSSAAARLAETINTHKNVTVDIGQVMFGQTVTISSDVLRQFMSIAQASPRKWAICEGEANGGGIVPYKYRPNDFHNAVQWAAGLELFLLIDDPARVFFTTDHPNGAPFTSYPDIFALLMDRELRAEWIARLPPAAMAMTTLPDIRREYRLDEIATMTRSAPARLLGLADRGHLAAGAAADVAIYAQGRDKAKMFREAAFVFKDGDLVVRDGKVVRLRAGKALHVTTAVEAPIRRRMRAYYAQAFGVEADVFRVPEASVSPFEGVPCGR